jgi:uncharacterized protein
MRWPGVELTAAELDWLHSQLDLARAGQTELLEEAIDAGLPVNLTASTGDSLLILATYHRHPDTVRMLLTRGADTERVNDHGQTALAAAVFRRDRRMATSLLAAGASPATGERSALQVAEFFGLTDMTELLTRPAPATPDPPDPPEGARTE